MSARDLCRFRTAGGLATRSLEWKKFSTLCRTFHRGFPVAHGRNVCKKTTPEQRLLTAQLGHAGELPIPEACWLPCSAKRGGGKSRNRRKRSARHSVSPGRSTRWARHSTSGEADGRRQDLARRGRQSLDARDARLARSSRAGADRRGGRGGLDLPGPVAGLRLLAAEDRDRRDAAKSLSSTAPCAATRSPGGGPRLDWTWPAVGAILRRTPWKTAARS